MTLQVTLQTVCKDNVEELRKINLASFPVQYNKDFYNEVARNHKDRSKGLNLLAYWKGQVVGGVCTRKNGDGRLYIMTLAVLAPYRNRGIGSQLLQAVLEYAQEQQQTPQSQQPQGHEDILEISLHVQISNHDAIRFYTSRFDFVQGDMVENYYRRIDPPHCYHLYKILKQPQQQQLQRPRESSFLVP